MSTEIPQRQHSEEELRSACERYDQEHLLRHWDDLDEDGRSQLADQIRAVDLDHVQALGRILERNGQAEGGHFEPPEVFPLERDRAQQERAREAVAAGEEILARGAVGFLLVAGGQASRLGYDGPKGAFPVGPVSGRSLFEFHARRLLATARRYGTRTPFYVMTSPTNDGATRRFFEQNEHFGLPAEDVFFFTQSMLPALDETGRVMMSAPDALFLAPDGHGGVLPALRDSGWLADALERGLEHLSYFQVDNPLVRPTDPLFIGLHALAGAGMSSKVVSKSDPDEKVGVLGKVDGRLGCIEYSDLPADLRDARDENGSLLFRAGNVAVHVLRTEFVDEITRDGLKLPWHVARKKIRTIDEGGRETECTGFKFEAFVFDALGFSTDCVTLEVAREREFSPVKNADGGDSPETARRSLCDLHASWARAAGLELPPAGEDGVVCVEVDPLLADTADDLAAAEPRLIRNESGLLYE
ncbi:MAG: UDPGP type 1 family protein [Planctomycetota bacterium]|jgi:UDP-N-acetylglucosamine/UDP-N-acetylgalactosamine diphosphorylase|nr:UDPGP type 1 family protein [Planctomycetota bacterium]